MEEFKMLIYDEKTYETKFVSLKELYARIIEDIRDENKNDKEEQK